jgi:hypothetical protein
MSSLGEVLYLCRNDIEKLKIPIKEVIQVVEEAFLEKAEDELKYHPSLASTLKKTPSSTPCPPTYLK